jgi:hypothetical protein
MQKGKYMKRRTTWEQDRNMRILRLHEDEFTDFLTTHDVQETGYPFANEKKLPPVRQAIYWVAGDIISAANDVVRMVRLNARPDQWNACIDAAGQHFIAALAQAMREADETDANLDTLQEAMEMGFDMPSPTLADLSNPDWAKDQPPPQHNPALARVAKLARQLGYRLERASRHEQDRWDLLGRDHHSDVVLVDQGTLAELEVRLAARQERPELQSE